MSLLDPDCILMLGVAALFDILGVIFWLLQFFTVEISEIFEYLLVDIPPLIIIGGWMLLRNQDIQQLRSKSSSFGKPRGKMVKKAPKKKGGIKIGRKFFLTFLGEFMPGIETILPWPTWIITVWQAIREGEEATNEARAEARSSQTLKRKVGSVIATRK